MVFKNHNYLLYSYYSRRRLSFPVSSADLTMAKRANPYSEDFVQQSKIHVSLKQFNNNDDRLKKVYEKTLLMLFQGAKKSQNQDVTHESNVISGEKKERLKQLFIGKNGTLSHLGTMVHDPTSTVCEPCVCGSVCAQCCEYCERALCSLCLHLCALCQHLYCSKCSIIGSEGTEICVSCYS